MAIDIGCHLHRIRRYGRGPRDGETRLSISARGCNDDQASYGNEGPRSHGGHTP